VALEPGGRRLACGWRDGSVSSLDAPVPRGR
jgi:hypothetical protein